MLLVEDQRENAGQEKMNLRLNYNALKTDRGTLTGRHCVQQTIIYNKVIFAANRHLVPLRYKAGL